MKRRIFLTVVAVHLVVCLPAASRPVSPRGGQTSEEEIARALDLLGQTMGLAEVDAEGLKEKVVEVGKLPFLHDVPIDFMSREELSHYVKELFAQEYPVEVAEREERALRALGFLEPGQDLRELRFRVLNENIAGFYDERPRVRKLFAISSGRKLDFMNQLILSHELRHALQDQYLDLRRTLGNLSDFDDRRLAALSLIEGDATLLMEKYMASGSGQNVSGAQSLLGGLGALDARSVAEMFAGPALRSAPPVVREQLMVPYLDGRRLAGEIYRRGGFERLNEYLRRLPRSMEQVLHTEKYLDRAEEPVEVNLLETAGEWVEFDATIGELFIRTLFESVLPQEDGLAAAAGWGGDHCAVWADADGRYHLVWRSVWDSSEDAREFFDALVRFSSIRFGRGPTPPVPPEVVHIEGPDGSRTRLALSGREVRLAREGFQ